VTYNQTTYVAVTPNQANPPGSINSPWVGGNVAFEHLFGQSLPTLSLTNTNAPTCIIGELRLFPYQLQNGSWLPADGRLLPIAQYDVLFSLLGTQFGGNGVFNFGLPDYRAVSPTGTEYQMCIYGYYP
jgi:hypothetical protein